MRPSWQGRQALVLGASGFIGRWVCRRLSAEGATVVAAVRNPLTASVLEAWDARATVVAADVAERGSGARLVRTISPDVVFNLIGYGVDRTERDEALATRLNSDLPLELAEAASALTSSWPGQRLIHTGSALEYGDVGGHLAETVTPRPTTVYGRTKLAGTLGVARAATGDGRSLTARLFTVYGPGEHEGRLLPTLLEASAKPGPVQLSTGDQVRDFTYVDDVAEGLVKLSELSRPPESTFNLSTGVLHTVHEFIMTAARILRISMGRLEFGAVAPRPEEMVHASVSVDRVRSLLGWCPTTDIAVGISRTREFLAALGRD